MVNKLAWTLPAISIHALSRLQRFARALPEPAPPPLTLRRSRRHFTMPLPSLQAFMREPQAPTPSPQQKTRRWQQQLLAEPDLAPRLDFDEPGEET